jgi:hypothetical protein
VRAREERFMSAESPLSISRFAVGARTCVMTIPKPRAGEAASCVIEWLPDVPTRLTPAELAEYRAGRDQVLTALSRRLGITAAVVEL